MAGPKPTRVGHSWTDQECDELREELIAGKTIGEIARIHSRTIHGVLGKMLILRLIVASGYKYYRIDGAKPWTTDYEIKKLTEGK